MTEENQRKLYEHFKKVASGEKVVVSKAVDVKTRALENMKNMEKAYPHFKEDESKSKVKK